MDDLNKLKVPELKQKLRDLGARLSGNKSELVERVRIWEKNNLSRNLLQPSCVNSGIPQVSNPSFPSDDDPHFVPLGNLNPNLFNNLTESHIDAWFEERQANKGRAQGKKLFSHRFVKRVGAL